MVIGYSLYGADNDSFMIDESVKIDHCPNCNFIIDFGFHNPFYRLKKKNYDYSHPYDIGTVVSQKFKEFCMRAEYQNIEFLEFERSPGFFQFYPHTILEFDLERANTRRSNYCSICNNFAEVIGSNPAFLKNIDRPLEDGFFRSDVIFGTKNAKNPIVVVGLETYRKIKRERLKGMTFKAIEL